MDIAGHVSPAMLKHYSHIRMEAKRRAEQTIVDRLKAQALSNEKTINAQLDVWMPQELKESAEMLGVAQQSEVGAYQKSTQATELEHSVRLRSKRKPLKGLAPQVGLEPTTLRLTAECSAIELLRNR